MTGPLPAPPLASSSSRIGFRFRRRTAAPPPAASPSRSKALCASAAASGSAGPGKTSDRVASTPTVVESGNVTFAVVDLLKKDYDLYYAGFANRALWPICHYRLDLVQMSTKQRPALFPGQQHLRRSARAAVASR